MVTQPMPIYLPRPLDKHAPPMLLYNVFRTMIDGRQRQPCFFYSARLVFYAATPLSYDAGRTTRDHNAQSNIGSRASNAGSCMATQYLCKCHPFDIIFFFLIYLHVRMPRGELVLVVELT